MWVKEFLTAHQTGRASLTYHLRALRLADSTPSFLHATTGVSQAGTDSAYADDLQRSRALKPDFNGRWMLSQPLPQSFNLTINVKKLRLLSTSSRLCTVYTHNTTWIDGVAQWTPNPLVVDNVGSVKYLGLEIDIDGSGRTQFALSRRWPALPHLSFHLASPPRHLNTRLHVPQPWRNFCTR
jgi:hypothetical protein